MADVYPKDHVARVPALTERVTIQNGKVVADGQPISTKRTQKTGGTPAEKVEETKPAKRKRN